MSFSEKAENVIIKISELWIIKCIRNGLLFILPLTLIGAFSLLILNFPIPQFRYWLNSLLGVSWQSLFTNLYNYTFSIISITAFFSIGYQICKTSKTLSKNNIPIMSILLITFSAYLIIMHDSTGGNNLISNDLLNINGLFNAILFCVIITLTFIFYFKHRLINIHSYSDKSNYVFEKSMQILEPAFLTLLTFSLIRMVLNKLGLYSLNINDLISFLLLQDSSKSVILYKVISQFLWFFGIHGSNVLESSASLLLNESSFFSKTLFDTFVSLGGAGASLCLIIALIINKKGKKRRITKMSIIPSLFNINEIILFGLPVVLNPFFVIPFILVPLLLSFTSYLAVSLGFIEIINNSTVMWTTPILIGGYQATGSINGIILQFINLSIGTIIYLPFVNLYDKYSIELNKKRFKKCIDTIMDSKNEKILSRNDIIGSTARVLANDIIMDFKHDKSQIFLVFQPLVDSNNKLFGAETLLRFKHDIYGFIPPPVIIKLIEEKGYEEIIGNWIIKSSIEKQAELNKNGIDILLSVNLSANQLKDTNLFENIKNNINHYNVKPETIEFELLENEEIIDSVENTTVIHDLQKLGCKIAVDDFGMGHSSIIYIKKFGISTIKIDGILVKDILNNNESKSIIKSICDLAKDLNLLVVAEFVETKEQRNALEEVGCYIYQGYYYSKPLTLDLLIDYPNSLKTTS